MRGERDVYHEYSVYLHFVDGQGRLFPLDHHVVVGGRGTGVRGKSSIGPQSGLSSHVTNAWACQLTFLEMMQDAERLRCL
jgi:hypothetical protein